MPAGATKKRAAALTTGDETSAKKRKFAADKKTPKYYGVRAGHKPGVYEDYDSAKLQTVGFKGHMLKSFLSRKEAADFVSGKAVDENEFKAYYAVAVGDHPGIYPNWTKAEAAIGSRAGRGVKQKKFETLEEATEFILTYGSATAQAAFGGTAAKPQAGKKSKTKGGTSAEDGSDVLHVWTDGASSGNGRAGAKAGFGVFFGHGDKRNTSSRLRGHLQTNQRAELAAIQRALQLVAKSQALRIVSDSKYSINCVTDWYRNWMKNDWKTSTGSIVQNQDLIKAIRELIDARDKAGAPTMWKWVAGHATDPGNIAADRLAVAGTKMPSLD